MTRMVSLAAALALTVSAPATAVGFETPDEAVREYLEGVAQGDVERVLEATAVDEMAAGYRFEEMLDRRGAFSVVVPGPVHSPFFADIQHVEWTARLLGQSRMLAYSLLAPDPLADALELMTVEDVDGAWATELMAELDQSRLENLVVAAVVVPAPELQNDSSYLEHSARSAGIFGADEETERVAFLYFEGDPYVVGFTLLRYGDEWKVEDQASVVAGTPPWGAAQPITVEDASELTPE